MATVSTARLRVCAQKLLAESQASIPAEQFIGDLLKFIPNVSREELEMGLAGLLSRKVVVQDEQGNYSTGPTPPRQRTLPETFRPISESQAPVPEKKRPAPSAWTMPTRFVSRARLEPEGQSSPQAPAGQAEDPQPAAPELPMTDVASQLSPEQREVMDAVLAGENVFFTGLPGTGKSFTLCAIIEALRNKLTSNQLAICASTGAAACHVGGGTLHSFLGCGLGKKKEDFEQMVRHQFRLRQAKTIVVDEISMISGEFLQGASQGLATARGRSDLPFGGVQIVFCGDFLQLPPIANEPAFQRPGARRFAFQAACWEKLKLRSFELTINFRQAEDTGFQELLRRARVGILTDADRAVLMNKYRVPSNPFVMGTTLYCRNMDVEKENLGRLAQLPGDEVVFTAQDSFEGNRGTLERILEKCQAAQSVSLKVGARVMLLKNLRLPSQCSNGQTPLVNGSIGEVVAFHAVADGQTQPIVRFANNWEEMIGWESFHGQVPGVGSYKRSQMPLKLAWAVSVHKSQGMTLDGGVVDLRGAFEEGQVYVALSRFRSASSISVLGLPPSLRVSKEAMQFHAQLSQQCPAESKVSTPSPSANELISAGPGGG